MAQAELNVMTAGHVDHGKTTLVMALTGKWTDTHSEEIKRGITIKLGYADVVFRKCPNCDGPKCYTTEPKCAHCNAETQVLRKVSFVDAPGHETLMATVIAASSIVDGALLVIAANEKCPQPQTLEHLMVLDAAGIRNIVIAQNKVDLVSREQALQNYNEIKALLKDTPYENATIVPTVANSKSNIDALIYAIEKNIPTPKRDADVEPRMLVARSFDVNKPGASIDGLIGGVVGGSIVRGKLRVGDEVELLPGILVKRKDKEIYEKVATKIVSLNAGNERLDEAKPGGLIGLGTILDPSLTRADSLAGCILGRVGTLPEPKEEIDLETRNMKRTVEKFPESFIINEPLVLGIGTETTVGFIQSVKKQKLHVRLKKPIVASKGDLLAVMRRAGNRWHLFGTGKIM
ncbi:translation initiation factor IF-2 subunit gamma [Candidatus Micrarchaeota archaeon]|nr:translation initiation factor IF-2 subunit gamma [Candidatus Micrarchaeota archaeon]